MTKEYLKDLIKNFDQVKIHVKEIKDDGDNWIKYEKEWPEYIVFPTEKELNIIDEYPELSKLYSINKKYKQLLCTDYDYYSQYDSIKNINGVNVPDYEFKSESGSGSESGSESFNFIRCDYCDRSIINDKTFYRCSCNKDMCNLCEIEKTEEQAIKNGSNLYNDYKDILQKCFNNCILTQWKSKDYNKNIKKLLFTDGFNTLIELVPIILCNTDMGNILMNCNPESKNYKCLYIHNGDDHGRSGIFKCKEESLKDVLDKFEEYRLDWIKYSTEHKTKLDPWGIFYSMPHKKYLTCNGNDIHYG